MGLFARNTARPVSSDLVDVYYFACSDMVHINRSANSLHQNKNTSTKEERYPSLSYLGFSLYWSWVYLSFNSVQITGNGPDGSSLIPLLHIVSGFAGVFTFLVVIALRTRIEQNKYQNAFVWVAAICTTLGTLFYSLPLSGNNLSMITAGAILSGLASPLIAIAWGQAYCSLNARQVTTQTAGSFLIAAILYVVISLIPQPISGMLVAFMPMLSIFVLYAFEPMHFAYGARNISASESSSDELSTFFSNAGIRRIVVGLILIMFVCGGLRMYIMGAERGVYSEPLLMALPIAAVAVPLLFYGASLSHEKLNLGLLYRASIPLLAIACVIVAISSTHTAASFVIVSAGSALIDMLTWILLIEIIQSTHFSSLLVLAVGRLAIHLGMATGEICSFGMPTNVTLFIVISIFILTFTAGYAFLDSDTTFSFEPATAHEMEGEFLDISTQTAQEEPVDSLGERIASAAEKYELSPRETEVFTLWATGHGSRAIEEKLSVSPATVKTHLRHIYEKCGVHSRAEILDLLDQNK